MSLKQLAFKTLGERKLDLNTCSDLFVFGSVSLSLSNTLFDVFKLTSKELSRWIAETE